MAHNGQHDQVLARRVVMVQALSQEDERHHNGENVQLVPTVVPPGLGGAEGGQGVVEDVVEDAAEESFIRITESFPTCQKFSLSKYDSLQGFSFGV